MTLVAFVGDATGKNPCLSTQGAVRVLAGVVALAGSTATFAVLQEAVDDDDDIDETEDEDINLVPALDTESVFAIFSISFFQAAVSDKSSSRLAGIATRPPLDAVSIIPCVFQLRESAGVGRKN